MPVASHPRARDDLEVMPREKDGEVQHLLGDPIRGTYRELDELQYEIFKLLDGRHSLGDIARRLVAEHEVEVTLEEISSFVENLQNRDLLDPASDLRADTRDGVDLARRVQEQIAADGVRFSSGPTEDRRGARRSPRERRTRRFERDLVDAALKALANGSTREAAQFLRATLDFDPQNARARYLLHLLTTEHFGRAFTRGSLLFRRIPLFNPNRLLERWTSAVGDVILSAPAFVLWLMFVVGGIAHLLLSFDDLAAIAGRCFSVEAATSRAWLFPVLLVFRFFQLFLHELAHGFVCRAFGGRPREIGIMLSYFMPGAYCDVTSTHLIEGRAQRALVSLIGPIFDLAWLVAAANLMLSLADGSAGQALLFYLSLSLLIAVVMNLHPLVKNDGYLALAEILDYPPLREDAFDYQRLSALKFFFGERVKIPALLLERKGLLVTYGVLARIATIAMSALGIYMIGSAVISKLHLVGLALITALVALAVWGSMLRTGRMVWLNRKLFAESRRFRAAMVLVPATLIAIAVWPVRLEIDATAVVEHDRVTARATVAGTIRQVLVIDGESVTQGQPIVALDSREVAERVIAAEHTLAEARAQLSAMEAGATAEERAAAATAAASRARTERVLRASIARLRRRVDAGLASRSDLDALTGRAAKLRTTAEAAAAQVDVVEREQDPELVSAASALVELAQAELVAAIADRASLVVAAPASGVVQFLNAPRGFDPRGAPVTPGSEVASVLTGKPPHVELRVPLTAPFDEIEADAPVALRFTADPGRAWSASLRGAGRVVNDGDVPSAVALRADVEGALPWPDGATAEARITGPRMPGVWHAFVLLRRLVFLDLQRAIDSAELPDAEEPSDAGPQSPRQ